jgi:hypothetical protein
MLRKCPKCFKTMQEGKMFCPDCKCMARPISDGIGLRSEPSRQPKRESRKAADAEPQMPYDEWEPPAAMTLYCKIYHISYEEARANRAHGRTLVKMDEVALDLEAHKYNCKRCSFWSEGVCSKKNRQSTSDSICKNFEPGGY